MTNCAYCLGERCPCDCAQDCGTRQPWCPAAEGYLDYLRSTGFYSTDELDALAREGYR